MPFCYSPWTNIDISPQGDIAPCCQFNVEKYKKKYNIGQHTIKQYRNSDLLATIKQDFDQDRWPLGCERCQIEESHGLVSKRLLDAQRWENQYSIYNQSQEFITASLAFGNTCNLKCVTCGPYASSRWAQEHQDLFGHTLKHFKFYKESFVQDILEHAPNLVHIDIPGGEPFLSGIAEQKQLLEQYVLSGQAKNISIHYTTNATVYPDHDWWNLWKDFKKVEIQFSVDGIQDRYQYIRYPAEWQQVVDNIKTYQLNATQNVCYSLSHTLSAYNIFYLDEFLDWCYTEIQLEPWIGRVSRPQHLRLTVWPKPIKEIIAQKLSNSKHQQIKNWINMLLNEDDSEYFEEFRNRTTLHDQYRGTNFADVFPELAQYL